jgi:serine/threonine protein kinase
VTARTPGARVGEYTLVERLAVGGMSEVFLATQPGGARVVLKLLSEQQLQDAVLRDLLRNEAALAHAAAHPNVVRVLEQGESAHEPYIALEYVDGVDLWRLQRALHQTQRRMEAPLACHVVRELLAGVSHIHSLHGPGGGALVHRDVSPSNVFLSRDGDVKLGDFGIALPTRGPLPPIGGPPTHPTPPGAVAAVRINRGKAGYMAPEQLMGQPTDPRVDLFAAGVVLAEVLTGRPLFAGLPGPALPALLAQRERAVEALGEVLADHPPSLVSVVMRALARTPAERFQSAQEFRVALSPHAGDVSEARPLLAALVHWARTTAQRASSGSFPAVSPPRSDEGLAAVTTQSHGAADTTREVLDVYYELLDDDGAVRGRHTLARLVELALADSLGPHDPVRTPDGRVVRASELSELAPVLPQRTAPSNEQSGAVADWADVLSGCSYLHALGRLVFAEETGMLVAEAAPARRVLYLHRGRPTHIAPSATQDNFGDFLVQQGLLNPGELDMALAIAPRLGGDLSEALVHLELIDGPNLARVSARFARERLLDTFRWRRGTLRFFRGVDPSPGAFALEDDAFDMLHAGAMLLDNPQDHFSAQLDRRVGIAASVRGLHRLGLSAVGHDLLALADGMLTLARLVQRVAHDRRAPPGDVLRELYFLLEVGVLELRA